MSGSMLRSMPEVVQQAEISFHTHMVLRPRGCDYDVSRYIYEATKRSFMMRCLYGQKTLCCGSVV